MNIKQWSESCQCSSKMHSSWRRRMKLTHLFSMHLTVFWRFQGVEKGCIGNKWVNRWKCWRVFTSGDVWCARLWIRKYSHTVMYSSVSWALSYLALFSSFQVFLARIFKKRICKRIQFFCRVGFSSSRCCYVRRRCQPGKGGAKVSFSTVKDFGENSNWPFLLYLYFCIPYFKVIFENRFKLS